MSSLGDYVPVRVGPTFGIAPCGELWAKEWHQIKYVRVANAYKMVSYTLILLKKFAARPRRESFFIAKRGGEKISVAKMKFRSSARPDLRITPSITH